MKVRYEVLGTLLTIKNIINYFVFIGSHGIFQGSALKTVLSVLFFLKCIKKKYIRSTWAEQFYLVLFSSFIEFLWILNSRSSHFVFLGARARFQDFLLKNYVLVFFC